MGRRIETDEDGQLSNTTEMYIKKAEGSCVLKLTIGPLTNREDDDDGKEDGTKQNI